MSTDDDPQKDRARAVATVLSVLNSRMRIMCRADMEKAIELIAKFRITANDLLEECRAWAERC